MAVYGYVRVSTLAQAEEGLSLGVQERTLEGYAMMQGMALSRVFIEHGVSGSIPLTDRPEGADMMGRLQRGDTIITPKLDRMFRSARDAINTLEDIKKLGCSLHMIDLGGDVTGEGTGKMVFTILSAVAENERDRIRERIATVKADQRKQGLYLGGRVPFGYTVTEGRLVAVEAEQRVIGRMRSMKARGATLRAIQEHVAIVQGRRVSLDAISRICAEAS